MVRWLGQRDEFRCGPVALVNIMKWAGIREFNGMPVNESLAKGYLTALCHTDEHGTFEHDIEHVLHAIPGLAVQKHPQPTRWDVKGCLKSDGIVLLSAPWWDKKKRENVWHFSLLVEVYGKGIVYLAINEVQGTSRWLMTGRSVGRLLGKDPSIMAYFIWKDTGWADP